MSSPKSTETEPHIFFYISGHGYGHLGQCIPVINYITNAHPNWRLSICSTLDAKLLKKVIHSDFEHHSRAYDFGMLMLNALEVDQEKTEAQFNNQINSWDADLNSARSLLAKANPSVVINNVSYLIPTAAKSLSIPTISFSSLNWFDIAKYYFPDNTRLLTKLFEGYRDSDYFACLTPGMDATFCENWQGVEITVGAVAQTGQRISFADYSIEKNKASFVNRKVILVSMGGIPFDIDFSSWPLFEDIVYITAQTVPSTRADIIPLSELECNYSDVLASCDLLITKPGYGNFVEAAAVGVPILYVPRPDWPEQPCLINWIEANTLNHAISLEQFESGDFNKEIRELIGKRYESVELTGVESLSDLISELAR